MGLLDIPSNGDYWLDLHGASKHISPEEEYNEKNLGMGVTYKWDDGRKSLTGGTYRNSYGRPTLYFGGGIDKYFNTPIGKLGAGIVGGIGTGYTSGITPMLLPRLSIGNDNARTSLLVAPEIKDLNPLTFMLSTQFKF